MSAFDQYNFNSDVAGNYTEDGHLVPSASNFQGYWSFQVDGIDHTYTASAAGSRATMTTNGSAPDANTVIFSTSWDFVRAAGAPFGNTTSGSPSVSFVAEADLTYTLAGTFSNSGGVTELDVRLINSVETT